ncbi:MAG: PaaI family thioesterase [Lachnospiraceae bacterium]|nr:PaaI family thioesterase [Lachnospiraceae bacterium]
MIINGITSFAGVSEWRITMNYDHIKEHFYNEQGFIHLLGMRITEISQGYCKGEISMKPEILNPQGIVHGGCTFALADTIGGSAALTHGKNVVTVDSTIHYLTPAYNTQKLIAEAREIKYGSRIAVYEVNIFKDNGTLVAISTQSYFIMET